MRREMKIMRKYAHIYGMMNNPCLAEGREMTRIKYDNNEYNNGSLQHINNDMIMCRNGDSITLSREVCEDK